MRVAGDERRGQQPRGREPDRQVDRAVDRDSWPDQLGERFAPHVEDDVGADERVPERGRLLHVELLGSGAVLGVGKVEVAWHPQQLAGRDRRAGRETAARDVGLERPEVATTVEDHRHRFADGEPADTKRDRNRRRVVEQRAAQQLLGAVVLVEGIFVEHVSAGGSVSSR